MHLCVCAILLLLLVSLLFTSLHLEYRETLALPRALIAQVEVFFHDPRFCVAEVSKIRPGGKAGALLLEWVRAALSVNALTPLFADKNDLATDAIYWDNAAETVELERCALYFSLLLLLLLYFSLLLLLPTKPECYPKDCQCLRMSNAIYLLTNWLE